MCVVLHFLSLGGSFTFIRIYTAFLCNVNISLWWAFIVKMKQKETLLEGFCQSFVSKSFREYRLIK